jgi:NADH dehydrogenase
VQKINFSAREVKTDKRIVPYDFLIVSIGSVTHFFNVPGASRHAFPLRTMEHAITLRNHILRCFEEAAFEQDSDKRRRLLTFVIVGGGPTGVEFAGALAELIYGPLRRDYAGLDYNDVHVVLVEATNSLLPGMPLKLRAYALKRLQKMGVKVHLQAPVKKVTSGTVLIKDGPVFRSETVVWTAGVRGAEQAETWGLPTTRDGRIRVLPTLQVPDHPDAYVIGDLAYMQTSERALPMIAPVAIQQGVAAAQNVVRQMNGKTPVPFQYRDRGVMVAIGRNSAVAHVFGRTFTGFPAWALWLGVHLFNLIGFRNRIFAIIDWAWDYFFYERAVRLILP